MFHGRMNLRIGGVFYPMAVICFVMVAQARAETPADQSTVAVSSVAMQGNAQEGKQVFVKMGCAVCHQATRTQIAPTLRGLYESKVKLQTGEVVEADEAYIRESILKPSAKIVAGYQPIMPGSFGQNLSEKQLSDLLAYIKSLKVEAKK